MLGLRFCARAFSSRGKRGPLLIAVRGHLTVTASVVSEHRLQTRRLQTRRLQTRRLSNCGSRAQSLRGMWDPPRPGLKPVSPASAGRLSTTAPPGKPYIVFFNLIFILYWGIVDLQCCVNFRYTAKWFSYTYTYIHSFSDSFLL